jgi:hypothetical protein
MAEATRLYRLSLALGARYLARRGYLREAVIRLVIPMDPPATSSSRGRGGSSTHDRAAPCSILRAPSFWPSHWHAAECT